MRAPPSGPTLSRLQQLRTATVTVASLTDQVLLGQPWAQTDALARLPQALRVLQRRAQQALDTLAQEGPR